jgi:hypothetical protein
MVYVIIPILVAILGFEFIIYQNEIRDDVLLGNALIAMIPIVFSFLWSRSLDSKIYYFEEYCTNDRKFLSIIPPFLWIVAFISFNGLNYRDNPLNYTFGLKACFLFLNTVVVLFVANAIIQKSSRLKMMSIKSLLFLSFLMILLFSGSRGLFFQTLMALLAYFIFKITRKKVYVRGFISYKVSFNNMKAYTKGIKYFFLVAVIGVLLAMIGIARDGTANPIFEAVFRLSEPYWYFAYEVSESSGFKTNYDLFYDSIARTAAIFFRGIDLGFSGSLDGKEIYIEQFLSISSSDQVSLPITLIGHGYLISGFFGAVFAVSFASLIIILTFSMIKKIPFKHNIIKIALMLLIVAKIWNLHAKSISGVVLYMMFETLRDIAIIWILDRFFLNRNLSIGTDWKK